MPVWSLTHFIYLTVTIIFLIATMYLVSKLNKKGQNIMFIVGACICSFGIFFRYGMGLSLEGKITWEVFLMQLLQVCNFNAVLVILMLVPKLEIARQYSFYFSMFAAATTFFSISRSFANVEWYNISLVNSWINHVFAVALPLWMFASRRLKPQKKYILPVLGLVFVYFTISYAISEILMSEGIITVETSFSFIYDTMKVWLLDLCYSIIPYPYFYLYPILPMLFGFFWLLARLCKKYKVEEFKYKK